MSAGPHPREGGGTQRDIFGCAQRCPLLALGWVGLPGKASAAWGRCSLEGLCQMGETAKGESWTQRMVWVRRDI